MTDQPPHHPGTTSRLRGRRLFLSGLLLGGLSGSLATRFALWPYLTQLSTARSPIEEPPMPFPNLDHAQFMRRAIEQAKHVPELPFGAVIVRGATGEVMAEGFNHSTESPSFHGEIYTINRCAAEHPKIDWTQLVLYTTAEPCPMCQSAIEWAGIAMVVYGSSIPFLQGLGWWQIDIRAEEVVRRTPFRKCVIKGGVLEAECNALFLKVPKGLYRENK